MYYIISFCIHSMYKRGSCVYAAWVCRWLAIIKHSSLQSRAGEAAAAGIRLDPDNPHPGEMGGADWETPPLFHTHCVLGESEWRMGMDWWVRGWMDRSVCPLVHMRVHVRACVFVCLCMCACLHCLCVGPLVCMCACVPSVYYSSSIPSSPISFMNTCKCFSRQLPEKNCPVAGWHFDMLLAVDMFIC